MNFGWIKVHRQIQSHWLYTEKREFSNFEAWVDIILSVNHSTAKVLIQGTLYNVNRGESINSLDTWGNRWKWSKSKVRRFFKTLESDNMIILKNEIKTTRLTVCNYDSYQDERNASETQVKRKRNASETQATPNKNEENENNENKPLTPKGEFDFDIYLEKLNKLFGKNLRVINDKVKKSIKARLKEGYSNFDIWNSMQNVAKDEWHKENNYQYATPQYFTQVKTLDMHGHKPKKQNNQIGGHTEFYIHE